MLVQGLDSTSFRLGGSIHIYCSSCNMPQSEDYFVKMLDVRVSLVRSFQPPGLNLETTLIRAPEAMRLSCLRGVWKPHADSDRIPSAVTFTKRVNADDFN